MSRNALRLARLEAFRSPNTPKKWIRFVWQSVSDDRVLAEAERQREEHGWGLIIRRITELPKRPVM